MSNQEILDLAMTLKPVERLLIIDGLLRSLAEPDHNIDELWAVVLRFMQIPARGQVLDAPPSLLRHPADQKHRQFFCRERFGLYQP